MRRWTKGLLCSVLVLAALLAQPLLVGAFDLIELLITIDLEPDEEFVFLFNEQLFPKTGYRISNLGDEALEFDATSSLIPIGRLPGEAAQESFALLDTTLKLELTEVDPSGGREIRATYRMDVDPRALGRAFLEDLLVEQRVVDEGRATVRARAMGLNDARIMRFIEGDGGGEWARAVRALPSEVRAEKRFLPNTEEDGVLGHYGNFTDETTGNAYVWAVMDRSSRYAVGFTVDRENDGVANSDDNCVDVANSDQTDTDDDGEGNACDTDDDDDSVLDTDDNCPLDANTDQADFDGDGFGDVCDADVDSDGVLDGEDECIGSGPGAIVDASGCSIDDRCPCEIEWKNHGAYVSCVARTSTSYVDDLLISEDEKGEITSLAGQSACGMKN